MANFVDLFLGYSLFSSYNYNLPLRAHIRIGPKQNSRLIFHKGGSVAEWLACWTQAQKGLSSNRSRDAVR